MSVSASLIPQHRIIQFSYLCPLIGSNTASYHFQIRFLTISEAENLYACLRCTGIFCSVSYVLCPFSIVLLVLIHWALRHCTYRENYFPVHFSSPHMYNVYFIQNSYFSAEVTFHSWHLGSLAFDSISPEIMIFSPHIFYITCIILPLAFKFVIQQNLL